MRIYLVRHGDAVPEDEAGSDRDRWLSAKGREGARILGKLLREQKIEVDAILSSPLPRAVQTAELLANSLDYLGVIASRRCFEPAAQPRVAADELRQYESVLVVTHEPHISSLGAFLLGIPAFPQFRTAQCCALENGKPTWTARSDIDRVAALFVD